MEDGSQPKLTSRIGPFLEFVHHRQEWKVGIKKHKIFFQEATVHVQCETTKQCYFTLPTYLNLGMFISECT